MTMVGKKYSTANFVFGFSSAPVLPAHPHFPVFLYLSLQPCSPGPPVPPPPPLPAPGLLPVNTLGAPWKPHTEWRESRPFTSLLFHCPTSSRHLAWCPLGSGPECVCSAALVTREWGGLRSQACPPAGHSFFRELLSLMG